MKLSKKYWLMGGLCLLSIGIITAMATFTIPGVGHWGVKFPGMVIFMPFFVLFFIISSSLSDLYHSGWTHSGWTISITNQVISVVFVLFLYFLIGSILGLLYGKFINRNKL